MMKIKKQYNLRKKWQNKDKRNWNKQKNIT